VLSPSIRPPLPSDRALIIDNWQKSFLGQSRKNPHGNGDMSRVRRSDYFDGQERLIDAIFRHPATVVRVACSPEDESFIWGWVCAAPAARLLHFVYVSSGHTTDDVPIFRKQGIATRLMGEVFGEAFKRERLTLTHWTRVAPCYRERWMLNYNPFPLYAIVADVTKETGNGMA
jgi:GNAT superfamily N-acetyltransferase